jgi:hypothetical protein
MSEEVSPESKIYVKEEIEKIRKEFKEDLKEAQSKATKTFTTVALIVGLLTGVGVYGFFVNCLKSQLIVKLESEAKASHENILGYEAELIKLKPQVGEYGGYAWVGNIKIVWGTAKSKTTSKAEQFNFVEKFNKCFGVVPGLAGYVKSCNETGFEFKKLNDIKWNQDFTYVAVGN